MSVIFYSWSKEFINSSFLIFHPPLWKSNFKVAFISLYHNCHNHTTAVSLNEIFDLYYDHFSKEQKWCLFYPTPSTAQVSLALFKFFVNLGITKHLSPTNFPSTLSSGIVKINALWMVRLWIWISKIDSFHCWNDLKELSFQCCGRM